MAQIVEFLADKLQIERMDTQRRIEELFGKAPNAKPGPTEEQQSVIDCPMRPGESLLVESGAGTGKTFCFIELSKARPGSRFLYICFSNKGAAEAREKYRKAGVHNTTCSTIHGLARETKAFYEAAGKFQNKITVKDVQRHRPCPQETAWRILETIKTFCESGKENPEIEHVPILKPTETPAETAGILQSAKEVWCDMVNPQHPFPVCYDHYLKIYQLTKPKLNYDYILLDESQDSNPLAEALLENQNQARIVLIGDSNQGIYKWRGALNFMEKWKPTHRRCLTESFRFGPEIAIAANSILNTFQKKGKKIIGHQPTDSVGTLPQDLPHTLIARTNSTLFETALEKLRTGKSYHFVGTNESDGWNPTVPYKFGDALDVYRLYIGDRKSVVNPHIKAFDSYYELKSAGSGGVGESGSSRKGDKELESLCRIVEKHTHSLPRLIQEIVRNCKGPNADVCLVTAHRAKGLEWPRVRLADDFAAPIIYKQDDDPEGTPEKRLAVAYQLPNEPGDYDMEEFNLIYVAITRAQERLEPNAKLIDLWVRNKELLPPGTQTPTFTPATSYIPKVQTAPAIPTETGKDEITFPIWMNSQAKELAASLGGRLRWKPDTKTWKWSHPRGNPLPSELVELKNKKRQPGMEMH